MEALFSLSEVGRLLDVPQPAVSVWVRQLGLTTKQHPSNARAMALTSQQVAVLRDAIEAGRRVVAQSA